MVWLCYFSVIITPLPSHTHTHTADLEMAEKKYKEAKEELDKTLAELSDM